MISLEAMALFELLAGHQQLLPSPSKDVDYAENSLFSCIPFILKTLTPDRLGVFGKGTWQGRYFISPASLRSTVYLIKMFSQCHIPIAEWTDMKVISLLVASLETTCGSRYFTGANLIRSLAAPRESEVAFAEAVAAEGEIFDAVRTLLFLERSFRKYDTERLVRWILFSRSLLANASSAPIAITDDSSATNYSRTGVVNAAVAQALSDTRLVYAAANPVRWQVKCLAAQLATGALSELTDIFNESSHAGTVNPHFDFAVANRECTRLCRQASEIEGRLPPTHLVFHLGDVLSSACMSCIATLDKAELQILQGSSIRFLEKLVACFAKILDPEEAGAVGILEQYSTQIFSSVKHALGAPDESDSESALRLFLAGCEALDSIVKHELTTDAMVLKRLIRPVLPTNNDVPFFHYKAGYPPALLGIADEQGHLNARASLLARIGKLSTVGKVLLGGSDSPVYLQGVGKELIKNEVDIAVHLIAVAIDGARLILGSNLTLAGQPLPEDDIRKDTPFESGFLYNSIDDIDDAVKASLVTAWSSCASSALLPLFTVFTKKGGDEEVRDACSVWIKQIVPLLFAGAIDALSAPSSSSFESSAEWTKGLDHSHSSLQVNCLRGLTSLVKEGPASEFESGWSDEMENVVDMILSNIFMPLLESPHGTDKDSPIRSFDEQVVGESCNLLRALSTSKSDTAPCKESVLLLGLLTPLNFLQNGKICFNDSLKETVIASCLEAVGSLIAQPNTSDSLAKAMLQLVLKTVLQDDKQHPILVKDAAKVLLKACLNHSATGLKERQRIASDLATASHWDMWAVLSSVDDGLAIAPSLDIVQKMLRDSTNSSSHLDFLSTLYTGIQSASIPSPLIGRVFAGIGGDILVVLYQYGTLQLPASAKAHRQTACGQSIKLTLIGYQQISSDESSNEHVAAFLSILFATLLAVLRFNGLPNHPSPQAEGDEALGRMSAQAILHIARTTPAPFKASMANLSEHDRGLLEFAVRAEMTGYVVQGQQAAAPKKKINVKSFK
jgi:hypothetical protein